MKKYSLAFVCFCLSLSFASALSRHNIGARASSLGQSSSMLIDLWSVVNNQSGMAFLESPQVGVFYEEKFQIKELGVKELAGVYPTKELGAFGVAFVHQGDEVYSEMCVTMSYAMRLGRNFAIGLAFDYLGVSITGDSEGASAGAITGELGAMGKVSKNLWLSVHLYNPFAAKITQKDLSERIPVLFRLGFRYHFSQRTFVVAELEKDVEYKARFKFGFSYNPVAKLKLRTGLATAPLEYSFGVGYQIKQFLGNFAFQKHHYLGYTPSFGITYTF